MNMHFHIFGIITFITDESPACHDVPQNPSCCKPWTECPQSLGSASSSALASVINSSCGCKNGLPGPCIYRLKFAFNLELKDFVF